MKVNTYHYLYVLSEFPKTSLAGRFSKTSACFMGNL